MSSLAETYAHALRVLGTTKQIDNWAFLGIASHIIWTGEALPLSAPAQPDEGGA